MAESAEAGSEAGAGCRSDAGLRADAGSPAGAGVGAGVFAGLTSGVLLFCVANLMTLSTLRILASRPDYQHQFAVSGDPNISTFLGDMLAGTISHLAINLVLGLIGGGIAVLILRLSPGDRTYRAAVID